MTDARKEGSQEVFGVCICMRALTEYVQLYTLAWVLLSLGHWRSLQKIKSKLFSIQISVHLDDKNRIPYYVFQPFFNICFQRIGGKNNEL